MLVQFFRTRARAVAADVDRSLFGSPPGDSGGFPSPRQVQAPVSHEVKPRPARWAPKSLCVIAANKCRGIATVAIPLRNGFWKALVSAKRVRWCFAEHRAIVGGEVSHMPESQIRGHVDDTRVLFVRMLQ